MHTLHTLIAGACLSALLAAPAAASVNDDGFGPLRRLAGSCWKSDAAPAFETCYRFDAGGRTLNARQYVNGHAMAESSIVESSRPGWLLETTRWTHSPYTVVYRLRIDPVGGRLWRETVRPLHDADRAENERRRALEVVDSIRVMSDDRFVFVRRNPFTANRSWAVYNEPEFVTWTFSRSRPCDAEDVAAASPGGAIAK